MNIVKFRAIHKDDENQTTQYSAYIPVEKIELIKPDLQEKNNNQSIICLTSLDEVRVLGNAEDIANFIGDVKVFYG